MEESEEGGPLAAQVVGAETKADGFVTIKNAATTLTATRGSYNFRDEGISTS